MHSWMVLARWCYQQPLDNRQMFKAYSNMFRWLRLATDISTAWHQIINLLSFLFDWRATRKNIPPEHLKIERREFR